MRITAITKFKHGDIYALLKKLDWTQNELARRVGVSAQIIGKIINLRLRPTIKQANTIQSVFGEAGEFIDVLALWPETFAGFSQTATIEQTRDIEPELLCHLSEALNVAQIECEDMKPKVDKLNRALATLTPREREVLTEKFGMNDEIEKTLRQIGKRFNVGGERIRQIQLQALRKLRHPSRGLVEDSVTADSEILETP